MIATSETSTHQFNDFNQHPVVGGAGHELEEERC
jgi:hypothetical protein